MPERASAATPSSVTAGPKSVSTTRPSSAISTLLGLTSRCRTPTRFAAFKAPSSARPIAATRSTGSEPDSSITCNSDRDGTYSMTIHGSSVPGSTS
jgi:hypothetical protein